MLSLKSLETEIGHYNKYTCYSKRLYFHNSTVQNCLYWFFYKVYLVRILEKRIRQTAIIVECKILTFTDTLESIISKISI